MLEAFNEAARSPENQTPVKKFAIEQAKALLIAAGVIDGLDINPLSSSTSPLEGVDLSQTRFGSIINRVRQETGESLRELAADSGVSPIQISRIERHECSPTEATMVMLAQTVGLKIMVIEAPLPSLPSTMLPEKNLPPTKPIR